MSERIVYLMRGLPSCGKSTKARQLAGDSGLVCETDDYFVTQVGDDPTKFEFRADLRDAAREWNFNRFTSAVDMGISPIVVDRGNALSEESQRYARYAVDHGYRVELAEPDSPWWQEIKVLLKYKPHTLPPLYAWAEKLGKMNRDTHRVSVAKIKRWIDHWKSETTVEDILNYRPKTKKKKPATSEPASP